MRVLSEVAAGHASRGEGAIFLVNDDAETPKAILKQLDEGEFAAYDSLWNNYEDDAVLPFIAKFEGVCEVHSDKGTTCKYLRMTNLLKDFRSPKVVDVKLGIRTFLEKECDNPKLRPDLYERMVKLYPSQVTEEDRGKEGITKLRWMSVRDANSTIRTLGFRIDGIAGYRRAMKGELDEELARLRQRSEVCDEFCTFAKVAATDDGREPNGISAVELAERLLDMLRLMLSAFETSTFVRDHECIGSSLLLVADAYGKAGVFWIDFGKTKRVEPGMTVTHRKQWVPGNHEDGILTGLDNMVQVWDDVVDLLRADRSSSGWRRSAKQRSFSGQFRVSRSEGFGRKEDASLDGGGKPVVKRTVHRTKLERSRTSPHHGCYIDGHAYPDSCSLPTVKSEAESPEEPITERVPESIVHLVFQRITDRLCGLCGARRPKLSSQC